MDEGIKKTVTAIPLLSVKAGPRDPNWSDRLKEELSALIASVNKNKAEDNDWFKIAPQDKTGTLWKGTCWFIHEHVKYEFNLQFEVPVTYPETAPEIEIPSLDGKTAKIYRCIASRNFKQLLRSSLSCFAQFLFVLQGRQNLYRNTLQAAVEQERPSVWSCTL